MGTLAWKPRPADQAALGKGHLIGPASCPPTRRGHLTAETGTRASPVALERNVVGGAVRPCDYDGNTLGPGAEVRRFEFDLTPNFHLNENGQDWQLQLGRSTIAG